MTKIFQLGEFGLIDLVKRMLPSSRQVIKGIGDDAAVLPLSSTKYLLFAADILIENVHFKRNLGGKNIGYKALGRNLSDIAAMGGTPKYAVVSLGLPRNLSVALVKTIYEGMRLLARKYGVDIVGGDTSCSSRIVINVAILGEVVKKFLILRSGAKRGDQIFVTGALGNSLKSGHHFRFFPRLKEAQYLVKMFHPTSMIDVSDGLASDLGHILKQSHVGAKLWEAKIPKRKGATLQQALFQGEDFELLFTLPARKVNALQKQKRIPVYHIGEINGAFGQVILVNRGEKRIHPRGFDHFC